MFPKNLLFPSVLILIIILITVVIFNSIKREKNIKEDFSLKISKIAIAGILFGVCSTIFLIGWFGYLLYPRKSWNEP